MTLTQTRVPAWRLAAYGLAAIPLAMAALPIYIHVPKFYADNMGLDLAAIGALLLAARVFDAVQDPVLGYWSDRVRDRATGSLGRLWFMVGGAPLLALGMLGLFNPPAAAMQYIGWWFIGMLLAVYTAFSMVQISYQAYGAEISDQAALRTRVTAFREGLGLIGVFLAAALPEMLAQTQGPRAGYAAFALCFAPLMLLLTVLTIRFSPPPMRHRGEASGGAWHLMVKPLRNPLFNRLLLLFVFNGIAASIPATLVLFFIGDVIKAPQQGAAFLIAYFAAGALGMPLWVWLSARIGKGRAWFIGMLLSIVAFVWAFLLEAGDVTPFLIICVLSGLGLGADLALPPSLLADVIDEDEKHGRGRNEGAYFGLWNLVTKLNLALAAGIALPLLGWLGYRTNAANTPEALRYLAAIYALLPCALKAIAAASLYASPFFRDSERVVP